MTVNWMVPAIWGAGFVHLGIIAANVPLPRRLRVRERLAGVPRFIRQIFYVHWIYIVIVLGLFAALCFVFAPELAGASPLGRFLSAFMAGFWLLRIILQIFITTAICVGTTAASTCSIWGRSWSWLWCLGSRR